MNISFYSGVSALIAQQDAMNIYSNNIANVNTVGFKVLRPSFADALYTLQHPYIPPEAYAGAVGADVDANGDGTPDIQQNITDIDNRVTTAPSENTAAAWETGHGVYVNKTDFIWEQGGLTASDKPMDYALVNEGFFKVLDAQGDTYLTRAGDFGATNMGDHWELVNANGDFVLDWNDDHITVPFVTEVLGDGPTVETDNIDYVALRPQIGVFTVDNNWGLDQSDKNHFKVTPRSGEPVPLAEDLRWYAVMEGYLEMSGTNLATEMVHLIEPSARIKWGRKLCRHQTNLCALQTRCADKSLTFGKHEKL